MTTTLYPPPSEPLTVARQLVHERTAQGVPLIGYWRGAWMDYTGPAWREAEATAMRKWLYLRLDEVVYEEWDGRKEAMVTKPWKPNSKSVSGVLDAMAALVHIPETVDTPSWLDPTNDYPAATEYIACRNGLLDVTTLTLREATPRYFGTVSVPFDWDADAPEPVEWMKFLRTVWPPNEDGTDREEIKLLAEWFGYVLSGSTARQKMFMLVGPPRSGKGTITRTLEALVGRGNSASPTLAGLATNFGLAPLVGKTLGTIADARLGKDNVNVVIERLLSISGEDSLTVDRKNRDAWTGKIAARLMLCSNGLPQFGDASGAIASRFLVATMERSFLGQEDTELQARIEAELPGILRWALAGLVRLNKTGKFTTPAESAEAVDALADLVSPISAFVREVGVTGPEESVTVQDLYEEWRSWCKANGHGISSAQKFSTDLRSTLPQLKIVRPKVDGRAGPRQFRGVGISHEWTKQKAEERAAAVELWASERRYGA
ncbi:phage/plasmid primase, P4 family [Pseudonocardia sp. WMMC193]|uniref:DNA primase family protein n=1 Tax=Pseudonocardia sp. WMMC193 TaxID=2911965 RepID=UPI001F0252C3|nr:phage/plasmid primase, P4 family [Pseudonocardia sp. WMMC193]MCF7548913.1 phage/plasmid primase, P4 family [Pseudonocardia sp. WMMC193]